MKIQAKYDVFGFQAPVQVHMVNHISTSIEKDNLQAQAILIYICGIRELKWFGASQKQIIKIK